MVSVAGKRGVSVTSVVEWSGGNKRRRRRRTKGKKGGRRRKQLKMMKQVGKEGGVETVRS